MRTSFHRSIAVGQPLTSQLKFYRRGEGIVVLHNGYYAPYNDLELDLYWEWSEKLSNLLPLDYGNPVSVNAQEVKRRSKPSLTVGRCSMAEKN